jgi:hypothetical protein
VFFTDGILENQCFGQLSKTISQSGLEIREPAKRTRDVTQPHINNGPIMSCVNIGMFTQDIMGPLFPSKNEPFKSGKVRQKKGSL